MADTLESKRTDAKKLIKEVLEKIPENRKIEALRIIEGFAICAEMADKKAG